jgi:integrase
MTKRARRTRDGLYRRENGIIAFRYRDKIGSWREKYTGTKDRTKASDFRRDFLTKLTEGSLPTSKAKWTVTDAATLWVEQHGARLSSDKARSNERSYLRQLVRRLGSKKVESIALDDLKRYQYDRRKEVRERPINLELRILINVLKEANLWKSFGEHYKPLPETVANIGRALTREELTRLEMAAVSNDNWFVAYNAEVLAANTGMRGVEIKKIRLRAIDLENKRIRIERKATKSDAGARLVELNQAAYASVHRLYSRAQSLGARDPDHYLLPAYLSRHTKPSDPLKGCHGFNATDHQRSWDTGWRNLRKAAGFGTLRFHDLRHTFITLMAESGVPLPVVQAMVGHMSTAMVRYYTHISNHAARTAVELLDAKLKSKRSEALGLWGNSWGKRPASVM